MARKELVNPDLQRVAFVAVERTAPGVQAASGRPLCATHPEVFVCAPNWCDPAVADGPDPAMASAPDPPAARLMRKTTRPMRRMAPTETRSVRCLVVRLSFIAGILFRAYGRNSY